MHKVIPILALLVVLGLIGSNLVYADYIDYLKLRVPQSEPNICIFEAEDPKVRFSERSLYYNTVKWIQEAWIDKLNEATNSNNWDVRYEFIANSTHFDKKITDFPQCHIMIVWDAENLHSDDNLDNAQGFTSFDYSNSAHKWGYINVFTMAPINEINLGKIDMSKFKQNEDGSFDIPLTKDLLEFKDISNEAVRVVVQHEFGHVIGLGHYVNTMTYDFKSIMLPQVSFRDTDDKLSEIQTTEDDIKALIELYGDAGFKEFNHKPLPKFGYGWVESTTRGTLENGDFLINFPDIIWLDPNFAQK